MKSIFMFEPSPMNVVNASGNGSWANESNYEEERKVWNAEGPLALSVFFTPLLVAGGTAGNLASVFVFYASKLRLLSTSQYLSALALTDTVFLLQLVPAWLYSVHVSDIFLHWAFCKLFVYLCYVTCTLSAWLVVAFTAERFVAVVYPLRRHAVCTVARARHVIGTLAACALLLNLPVLRFAEAREDNCNIAVAYAEHAARFNLLDTAVSFTAPLAIIIVLNAWIMVGVYRLERTRRGLVKVGRCGRAMACSPSQHRVTRMLLVVSSVFVILNIPSYVLRIFAYSHSMYTDEFAQNTSNPKLWWWLQHVAMNLFHTNFSINFLLYCLSGQNFRHALQQAMPCCCRRRAARAPAVRRPLPVHPLQASLSTSYASYTDGGFGRGRRGIRRSTELTEFRSHTHM